MIYVFAKTLNTVAQWSEANNINMKDLRFIATRGEYGVYYRNKTKGTPRKGNAFVVLDEGDLGRDAIEALDYFSQREIPEVPPRASIVSIHSFLKHNNIDLTPAGQGKLELP